MKIDTITMLVALSILCLGFSTTMILVWRFLLPMRSLLLWGCGMGCYGLGVMLMALRDRIPDILSFPVGNLLLLCCYSLIWIGISVYRGKAPWYRTILLILLLFVPCFSWFVWGVPNIAMRTALVRVFMLILLAGTLATMIRRCSFRLSFMEKVVAGAFSMDFAFRLLLIAIQIANLSHLEPLQKNMITAVSSIFSMVTMVSWGMAVVLLALENTNHELQSALYDREEQNRQNLLNQKRLQALLDISQFQAQDTQELLDFALDKVIDITGSQFGYIYHYHEERQEFVLNSWSKGVMPICSVVNPQTLYQLEKTGIWGEAVRQRKPILINDFSAENPLKKGYPEGHVPLERFLSVPVFDAQRIVAVVGVANKVQTYTDLDVMQLDLMMAEVWRIVKRIELEARLIHAGREWQTTFDAISDGVSLIDPEQRILRCNLASKRFFKNDFPEIIGEHCWKLLHGTDHAIKDCPMMRTRLSLKSESQLIFENGRWLHVTVDPLLDKEGNLTGAVHIIRDDTERVMAEQAQLELLAMLEAVHNELYVFSPDTLQFEYVNQTAEQNLGYSQKQLLQMTPLDLKPMARQELIMQIAPLLSGNVNLKRFETTHRRADGSQYPVEVNLQLVNTHSGNRCLAVIHDITERKQFVDSLMDSEALVSSIMNSIKSSIAVIDSNGEIIRVNNEWFNFAKDNNGSELLAAGVGINYLKVCSEAAENDQTIAALLEGIKSVQNRTLGSFSTEYACHSSDEQRWFIVFVTPLENSSGGVVLTHINITQRKKDERALQQMHAQLLQNEKMASIGQLSAGISHEINNPMGFINSNLGTLEKYVDKFDRYIAMLENSLQQTGNAQQLDALHALRKELKLDYVLKDIHNLIGESTDGAERVMKIVQDLKIFSRSDTEKMGRADLNQCLDSTINIIWNKIKYVAELVRNYGKTPKVMCNIQQVNQVFMNLLINAVHAIESKGTEEQGIVRVRTWADDDNAFVSVSDTGCGMSDEVKHKIFDPFFTTKDVGLGTGLGLSISHEIIKKHGGEITVESEVGQGTTFTVRLPILSESTESENHG